MVPDSPKSALRQRLVLLIVMTLPALPLVLLVTSGYDREVNGAPPAQFALVASQPLSVRVDEIPLAGDEILEDTALGPGRAVTPALARTAPAEPSERELISKPQTASGYATVGVTWALDPAEEVGDLVVLARTRDEGRWSEWVDFEYDAAHGPDITTAEGREMRAGTDPFPVGEVELVQVKVIVNKGGRMPRDLRLSIIDPGSATVERREEAAIPATDVPTGDAYRASSPDQGVTPRPAIFSRAQWGADERLRDAGSLHYGRVTMGFVHHTVNANDYTRDQVPSLLRGIYAYHTQSKGWSDIGYNFVVDRFGRIWEGRYGGVDRAVVGAHTLGYNDVAFAASALGNFETTKPSAELIDAYGRLFAWKLSLHGVVPSARVTIGSKTFSTISGHSDADSTACPGRYLYARLPDIREKAAAFQHSYTPRDRDTDLQGSAWPDVVLRDAETERLVVLRTGGQVTYRTERQLVADWSGKDLIAAAGDLTSDGIPDLIARDKATGAAAMYPGAQTGTLAAADPAPKSFAGLDQLTGVGDLTGDRQADVVGRVRETQRLVLYPGDGSGGFQRRLRISEDWSRYDLTSGAGDMTGDGVNDLVARAGADLFLVPGRIKAIGTPTKLSGAWSGYDLISGLGDATNDGVADLVAKRRDTQLTYVFRGDGRGNLRMPLGPFSTFRGASFLAVAGNWSGTRHPDIVARRSDGSIALYANSGGRNVASTVTTDVRLADTNRILNVGDWNSDGEGDIITRRASTGDLLLRTGATGNTFNAGTLMGVNATGLRLVAVGDLTGDGSPDLVSQDSEGVRRVLPGDGAAGFKRGFAVSSGDSSFAPVGVGRWDGDGSPDLLELAAGTVTLRRGNGPAYLYPRDARVAIAGELSGFSDIGGLGDLDGDGRPDLVARKASAGELWLLPASGTRLGPARFITDGLMGYDLIG